ncbi:MAG: right-handed parallel beta-helix repeat-containing protein [Planctomycetia bacterium]|nr:right-handed parallel beta-helix repeat-containing protein [Planctomycetia bacterium]
MEKRIALILIFLFWTLNSFAADLLNGNFQKRESNGTPTGWQISGPKSEVVPLKEGGVEVKTLEKSPNHFALSQLIKDPGRYKCLLLTGDIDCEKSGTAYFQIKFFKGRKELRRLGSSSGGPGKISIRLPFSTGTADVIQINCRIATDKFVGEKVIFSNLSLTPLPEGSLSCWENIEGNTAFNPEENAFTAELKRTAPAQNYIFRHEVIPPKDQNGLLEFGATVYSNFVNFGSLVAELYKDGEKIDRFSTGKNQSTKEKHSLRFSAKDADRIDLYCTFDGDEIYSGEKVKCTDFYFGPARPETKEDLPRTFEIAPGYQVCGIYLNCCRAQKEKDFRSRLRFRTKDQTQWSEAIDLNYIPAERSARGSIVKLEENTEYFVRLDYSDAGEKGSIVESFRTKSPDLPIAKTIELDPAKWTTPFHITESGTPDGYIRYTAKRGFTPNGGSGAPAAFILDGVSHIILDGMIIRGGAFDGIRLINSSNVHVLNCDIAEFGRIGTQRVDLDGKFYEKNKKHAINNDAGIRIYQCKEIRIERNFIHDPRGTSNSWFYSHPAGPNALLIHDTTGTAIRYNNFIGSDLKRWNDAVESGGNGSNAGSIWRDAEICGNYFAFGDDDGMELDGGQVNCRFFYNRTEGQLCGVSTAPCRRGPSYVFQNLFCHPGDEYDLVGVGIKNNYGNLGLGRIYFFNNTIANYAAGISSPGGSPKEYEAAEPKKILKGVGRNNLSLSGQMINQAFFGRLRGDFDYDMNGSPGGKSELIELRKLNQEKHGIADIPIFENAEQGNFLLRIGSPGSAAGTMIPNFMPIQKPDIGAIQRKGIRDLPYRPIPFHTDISIVSLKMESEEAESAVITLLPEDEEYASDFRIVQPDGAFFFSVSPDQGRLEKGKPITLTVSVLPHKVRQARRNTSAFIIQTPDGYARPVSVAVDSRKHPRLLAEARKDALYGSVQKMEKGSTEIVFDVPKDGEYWFFVKTGGSNASWKWLSLDGGEKSRRISLRSRYTKDPWINVAEPVFSGEKFNRPFPLKKGKHIFTLSSDSRSTVVIKNAALAADADAFRLAPDETVNE